MNEESLSSSQVAEFHHHVDKAALGLPQEHACGCADEMCDDLPPAPGESNRRRWVVYEVNTPPQHQKSLSARLKTLNFRPVPLIS
ncbi:MAG: hypothetical protein SGPRY_002981 [Prymnesium sp.]